MRLMLKNVRLSYANIWEPRAGAHGGEPMYSVALIMDPKIKEGKTNIAKLEKAVEDVLNEAVPSKFSGKRPTKWDSPIHEGDIDRGEAYDGNFYVNAKSKHAPGIVDQNVQPILDQSEVYSGCYANVSISLYAYNTAGKKGVGVGLGNIQKVADGESLGGNVRAEAEFSAIESDDDFLD